MKNAFSHFLQEQTDLLKQKSMACRIAISDQKFNEVMNFIKGKKYENERTDAAKKQLYINCVSTSQAQKIMTLFSHDREKIDVLKAAYYAVIDKENTLKLINEFQFQETRDEFSKFLDSKK
jgi:ribosomal protein L22